MGATTDGWLKPLTYFLCLDFFFSRKPIKSPSATVRLETFFVSGEGGDLVTIALQGDLGKPRPALVIQSDLFDAHPSVTILPVTGELRDAPLFRIPVQPSASNGLSKHSQVMVDKPQSFAREKVGVVIGRLDDDSELRAGNFYRGCVRRWWR